MTEHYCDCCGHTHGDLEVYEKVAQLEAEVERLRGLMFVLQGSPKNMLEFCEEHDLLGEKEATGRYPADVSVTSYWVKAIATYALKEGADE